MKIHVQINALEKGRSHIVNGYKIEFSASYRMWYVYENGNTCAEFRNSLNAVNWANNN